MAASGIVLSSQDRINDEETEQFLATFRELDKSAPRIIVKRCFTTYLWFHFLRPVLYGALTFVFKKQFDPTPIDFQQYRAEFARHFCQHFDLPDVPEVLIHSETCDDARGNHVWMLIRGEQSLCFNCWMDLLNSRQ
jgi:hypothetical protein